MSNMYSDTDSNEGNSTENLSPVDQFCGCCKSQVGNEESSSCSICFTKFCRSHKGIFSEIRYQKVCSACESHIKRLEMRTVKKLEIEKYNNKLLTSQIINSLKELQELKNTMKPNMNNIKIAEELINETKKLKQKFQETINEMIDKDQEIVKINCEINELNDNLNEKSKKIERISILTKEAEDELIKSKSPNGFEPMNENDLVQEHQSLNEKLRNIEIDNYSFTVQMIEVIQDLRFQITKEQNQIYNPSELFVEKTKIPGCENFEIIKELEDTKKKGRLLQEEVNVSKRHLELTQRKKI